MCSGRRSERGALLSHASKPCPDTLPRQLVGEQQHVDLRPGNAFCCQPQIATRPNTSTAAGARTRRENPAGPPNRLIALLAHARPARWADSLLAGERVLARRATFSTPRASMPAALVERLANVVAEFSSFMFSSFASQCDALRAKRSRQSMRRPRAMRFHAAPRATHHPGGLLNVEFLPVTHQEGFALTRR